MAKPAEKPVAKAAAAPAKAAPAPAKAAAPAKGAPGRGVPVPAPEAEVKKEEKKKEKISQKDRPHSKKKHKKVQIWKLYKVEGNKVTRKNEPCPRCGLGTFLAAYKNRKYCGKCGWGQVHKA